jgi:glycosyltransferase involved in cell wall biosynthesis
MMFPSVARHVSVLYDWVEETLVQRPVGSAYIRQELGLDDDIRLVGCVGRLEFWKGQHLFLKAAEKIAHQIKDVHFLIVGGPTSHKHDYATVLADLHRRMSEPERVTLLGHRDDISCIMRELAVTVHASLLPEPFGLVVMEAMQAGSVVVAANAGGVREQVEDAVTGFLYEPGNVDEMAERIVQALYLADPAEIGERAKQSVERRFAKTASVQALLNVYNGLLAKQSLSNEAF